MDCEIKKIQRLELGMLKECKRICDRHGIRYFLSQGTLIGAAREKGFISWDDDMDILVPYDDMDRLVKAFQEEGDQRYFITNYKIEKYYPHSWTKIRMHDTTSMPKAYKSIPIHWGICIDVFPVYAVSNIKLVRNTEIFIFKVARKLLMAEMTKCEPNAGVINRMIEKIPLGLRRSLAGAGMNVFRRHGEDTKYVYVTCRGGRVFARNVIYGEEKKLSFEDDMYPVPAKYHEYLTEIYGDYMTPPPENEQAGHELRMGDIIWDCEKGYENYK